MARRLFFARLLPLHGAALLSIVAHTAMAYPVEYVSQGERLFSFDVPEIWQHRVGPDIPAAAMPSGSTPAPRVISVRPPGQDGVMWTGLWSPPGVRDFAQSRAYLRRLGPFLLERPEVGYQDARMINGRPARIFSGTGERGGRWFEFVFAVIAIAPERVAVAAFIGEPGIFDRYEAELVDLLDSIRSASR